MGRDTELRDRVNAEIVERQNGCRNSLWTELVEVKDRMDTDKELINRVGGKTNERQSGLV